MKWGAFILFLFSRAVLSGCSLNYMTGLTRCCLPYITDLTRCCLPCITNLTRCCLPYITDLTRCCLLCITDLRRCCLPYMTDFYMLVMLQRSNNPASSNTRNPKSIILQAPILVILSPLSCKLQYS